MGISFFFGGGGATLQHTTVELEAVWLLARPCESIKHCHKCPGCQPLGFLPTPDGAENKTHLLKMDGHVGKFQKGCKWIVSPRGDPCSSQFVHQTFHSHHHCARLCAGC